MTVRNIDDDKDAVTIKARQLAQLLGDYWEIEVWYNLHWCYCVKYNDVRIYAIDNGFAAYYMPNSIVVGEGNTPQAALLNLSIEYKEAVDDLQKHYHNLNSVVLKTL